MKHIKTARFFPVDDSHPTEIITQGIMTSTSSSLGDAVRSDGTLKDVSEMVWSYDADETIPFPSGGNSGNTPSSGRHAPATADTAQAVRRMSCVIRPCRRYAEEDKAESASSAVAQKSSGVKR